MPYAENQGVRIHYEVEGAGPPIVMHHGNGGSIERWYRYGYVEALRASHQLILVDARGHGESDKPHDPALQGVIWMARDVLAVMDALAIVQAHYFGYSMGGSVGFAVACLAAERFLSFVLGGSAPWPRDLELIDARIAALQEGGLEALVPVMEAQLGPYPQRNRELFLQQDAASVLAHTIALRNAPSLEEALPRMRMPCLLYAGDADSRYADAERCSREMPNARFVSLAGMNHMDGLYHPEVTLPFITAFLAEVTGVALDS